MEGQAGEGTITLTRLTTWTPTVMGRRKQLWKPPIQKRPILTPPGKYYCKICDVLIKTAKAGVCKHENGPKHQRNILPQMESEPTEEAFISSESSSDESGDDTRPQRRAARSPQRTRQGGCHKPSLLLSRSRIEAVTKPIPAEQPLDSNKAVSNRSHHAARVGRLQGWGVRTRPGHSTPRRVDGPYWTRRKGSLATDVGRLS